MFLPILIACLAASSRDCGPILLPAGEAATLGECEAARPRITADWLQRHPGLIATGGECAPPGDQPGLELRQIAKGVYVHLGEPVQLEGSRDGRIANLGVVVGDTVAVIDSGASRAEGQALYAAIRRLTDRPISHVILTHMHPDHVLGAEVFAEAGAKVVGHHALATALGMRAQTYLDNMTRLYGPTEMLGTAVILPEMGLTAPLTLDLGGHQLVVTPVPTAHTDNDLMVQDLTEGVLFSGDLLFRQVTPVVDGSLTGWLEWQATPPQPAPRLIVPGHGAIAANWEEAVTPQAEFLDALADTTRTEIARGLPMSEAVPRIIEEMAPLAPGWVAYPETVARDATAAFKELEWQ